MYNLQTQKNTSKRASKVELRHTMRTQIKTRCNFEDSIKHVCVLRKTPMWQHAQVVFMFWPMKGEVDMRPLTRMAQCLKKCLWIPLPYATTPLYIRHVSSSSVVATRQRYIHRGIKTIRIHTPPRTRSKCRCTETHPHNSQDTSLSTWLKHSANKNTLMLVPGLAFTPQGVRLGRGAGFYDKLLHVLQKRCKTFFSVGLCHEMQLIPNIPTEQHDKKLTYIITEKRIFFCRTFMYRS